MEETKLTGTEKQIAWAEEIREEKFAEFEKIELRNADKIEEKARWEAAKEELQKETDAAAWIDMRAEEPIHILRRYYLIDRSKQNEPPFLPIETGTEKQIIYAQKIRADAVIRLDDRLQYTGDTEKRLNYTNLAKFFCTETDAKKIIDKKDF